MAQHQVIILLHKVHHHLHNQDMGHHPFSLAITQCQINLMEHQPHHLLEGLMVPLHSLKVDMVPPPHNLEDMVSLSSSSKDMVNLHLRIMDSHHLHNSTDHNRNLNLQLMPMYRE